MVSEARGTLHLISGLPCAGKSTYAAELQRRRDAVHFSLDRWLITLFGRYSVEIDGYSEHVRRVYACRDVIWSCAAELLVRGADVILDDGFFRRDDRRRFTAAARELGAPSTIHFIDTPPDVLRARLAARNQNPGEYHFEITLDALNAFLAFYEAPSDDEGAEIVVVSEPVRRG